MRSTLRLYFRSLLLLSATALVERAFFAVHNHELLKLQTADLVHALLWGLRFDFAVAGVLALLAFLAVYLLRRLLRLAPERTLGHFTLAGMILLILLQGGDAMYFAEVGRHIGYEVKETYNSGPALLGVALSNYTTAFLLQLMLIGVAIFAVRTSFRRDAADTSPPGTGRRFSLEMAALAVLLVSVVVIRGGLQSVPLEPLHAQEIGDPRKATVALNGAYNALFALATPYTVTSVLPEPPSHEEIAAVRAMLEGARDPAPATFETPPNVVLIFLESWTAAYMKSYGYDKEVTLHFDRLRSRSLTATATVAGGHRTTEGMFATLCSAQNPLGQTVAQTQLQDFQYRCLPQLLRERGYSTAFFQGSLKNTSGTGAFAQLLGFTESFGVEDIKELTYEKNNWGAHDPDLYRFVLDRLAQMPQPFLAGINTNSTHDVRLPEGVAPAFPGEALQERYLSALHFSDQALAGFVERLYADPRFANTLLVVVADHAGLSSGVPFEAYAVPFLIHHPERLAPRIVDAVVGQRDIAPTLLQLAGLPVPAWFTGRSLLSDGPWYADYYHEGRLGWAEGPRVVEFPLRSPDDLACFTPGPPPQPLPCSGDAPAARDRALAFTRVSQNLLFSGKLLRFGEEVQAVETTMRTSR